MDRSNAYLDWPAAYREELTRSGALSSADGTYRTEKTPNLSSYDAAGD